MSLFSKLNRKQKESVGLLQVGTFLEYFDLMLYIHMAILLNDLFFPKTDPHTAALLSAFAFCSSYVLRPIGALVLGYIGDTMGRKKTVIITTSMMAVSCLVMANLPTYAQIGMAAAWIITLCRIVQGFASMGEMVGAEIYLTETIKSPLQYFMVALIGCASTFGAMAALGVATLVTSSGFNWRIAFWVGALIAIIGAIARTRLRETPDFVDMKRKMKVLVRNEKINGMTKISSYVKQTAIWGQKTSRKTLVAYFAIQCAWPVCFYFSYIHCGNILKNTFGYTPEEVMHRNFGMSMVQLCSDVFFLFLSLKIFPLKLIRFKVLIFIPFVLAFPFIMKLEPSSFAFLFLQAFPIFFTLTDVPSTSIFIAQFPIFRRFTYIASIYALSRVVIYIVTSFGLVYLTEGLGHWGMWMVLMPVSVGFLWGVLYFEKLHKAPMPISP